MKSSTRYLLAQLHTVQSNVALLLEQQEEQAAKFAELEAKVKAQDPTAGAVGHISDQGAG